MSSNSDKAGAARFLAEFQAGEVVFAQGDVGSHMYIVHEGEVEIRREGSKGGDRVARLEKGDFFGEMSLLEELPRLATARAVTTTKLVKIDSAAFDKLLRRDPEIAIRIMRKLSGRLRQTDTQLRAMEAPKAPIVQPADQPSLALVHLASQDRFALGAGGDTMVGRGDPVTGLQPDIDLSPVDADRSSSRRHAKLFFKDGAYWVVEEIGTTNGTFVNGVRLESGQPLRIAAGDQLRFGLVELVLSDESQRR